MLTKCYTCEVIAGESDVVGSRACKVPIWRSALYAYKKLLATADSRSTIINFRRVS